MESSRRTTSGTELLSGPVSRRHLLADPSTHRKESTANFTTSCHEMTPFSHHNSALVSARPFSSWEHPTGNNITSSRTLPARNDLDSYANSPQSCGKCCPWTACGLYKTPVHTSAQETLTICSTVGRWRPTRLPPGPRSRPRHRKRQQSALLRSCNHKHS